MPRIIEIPNLDNLISSYKAGESELKLSREFKVSRNVIRKRLLDAGIKPRTGSEASFIRMSRMSSIERSDLTRASHAAARGRSHSVTERTKRAITRQARGLGISEAENIFTDMLCSKGIKGIIQQKAIGYYNVDIAIKSPRIAIEIMGGHWHTSQRHIILHHKRVPYILNAGWTMVMIWVDARNYPLTVKAADYVISLLQRLSLNKSSRGEYHVIRGNGQIVPILSSEFNCLPVVESPTSRDNMGRYYSNIRE